MKTTSTWMKVTKWIKYLDEHGASMNFWMITKNRQKIG